MSKVQLYIYEVTKGLAAQLSTALLGRYIPGVWHTGIVCYGMEYFFGSGGIQNIHPGTTIVGAPDDILDLGETQITDELFHEYLFSIGEDNFRPERYHLFDHNCNTFSNEVAQFLTGKSIPSYILNLPSDVANTPMGAMLKSFMDGFGSPVGGRADHSSQYFSRPQQAVRSGASRACQSEVGKEASINRQNPAAPTPVTFKLEANDCCIKLHELFPMEKKSVELVESVFKSDGWQESKTAEVMEALYSLFALLKDGNDIERCTLFIDVLAAIAVLKQCDIFRLTEGITLLDRLLKLLTASATDRGVIQSLLKLATILYSEKERREAFISGENKASFDVHDTFIAHCIAQLTGESRESDIDNLAVSFAFNISLSKVSEEAALELSSALIHWVSSAATDSPTGKLCVSALRQLVRSNHQIKDLAAMTIDANLLA